MVDPKAVLLVGDYQTEVGILDVVLDEGVGPNNQVDFSPLDGPRKFPVLLSGQRTSQQANVNVGPREHPGQLFSVLGCQNFRRGHQGGLIASRNRCVDGNCRDDGLSRPDIPLQEAVHLVRFTQVTTDFIHDPFLCSGQLETDSCDKLL